MKIRHLLTIAVLLCGGLALAAAPDTEAPAKTSAKAKPKAKQPAKSKKPKKKTGKAAPAPKEKVQPKMDQAAMAAATDIYKKELAHKIEQANPDQVYAEQPQALLRSVVVVEFTLNRDGKLLKSAIRRSNRDRATEATALASLRAAAPLPKPPPDLLQAGKLELHETWLFNTDGRFQIRSTAQPQIDR